jgi:thiamine pyrophosphokinase
VLSGAPSPDLPAVKTLPRPDRVVAADGGTALAEALGVVPDVVVGDLDSADPELVDRLREQGVEFRMFYHHLKAETDTELAVLTALRWHPESVVILGAIGGRLDHTLANVLLLTHPALGQTRVKIVDANREIYVARPGSWTQIEGQAGDIVTLLPLGGEARGVRLEGLEYPLVGETLHKGRGRGASNVLLSGSGRVWLDSGDLLVIVSHGAMAG